MNLAPKLTTRFPDENLLTIEQAAAVGEVTVNCLRDRIRKGQLVSSSRSSKQGCPMLFRLADVKACFLKWPKKIIKLDKATSKERKLDSFVAYTVFDPEEN